MRMVECRFSFFPLSISSILFRRLVESLTKNLRRFLKLRDLSMHEYGVFPPKPKRENSRVAERWQYKALLYIYLKNSYNFISLLFITLINFKQNFNLILLSSGKLTALLAFLHDAFSNSLRPPQLQNFPSDLFSFRNSGQKSAVIKIQ